MGISLRTNNRTLFSVLLTYFLDNFGLAIIYPIFTPLLIKSENAFIALSTPYLERTVLLGLLIACFPLAQFFGAPLIGQFSDRAGRKKAFYITIAGTSIGYTLTAISILNENLTGLFISRLATGFFAGNLTLCLSTIAHMSHDDTGRTRNFSLLNAVGGMSFIIAIAFGGILSNPAISRHFNPSFPFWITAFFNFLNLISMHYLFQEPHKPRYSPGFHPFKGIHHLFQGIKNRELRTLYSVNFLFLLAWIASLQFLPTLLLEKFQFHLGGITLALIGTSLAWSVTNLLVNRTLAKFYYPGTILLSSLPFLCVSLLFTAFSQSPSTFLCLYILSAAFASLCWTNGISTISLKAPLSVQGSILGINQSFTSLSAMLSPMIGGLLAGIGVKTIYAFGAISCIVAFILLKRSKAYEHHSHMD